MSNVLIGIIGVILFIGLAMASVVILGEDFMTAGASSRAAAISSHLQQYSTGINTLAYKRGVILPANSGVNFAQELVNRGAIKSIPRNPVTNAPYYPADQNGSATANPIRIVYTPMDTSARAKDVCYAIEEQAGNPDPAASIATAVAFGTKFAAQPRLGCFMNPSIGNSYTVYIGV